MDTQNLNEKHFHVDYAAKEAGVSQQTIRNAIHKGFLKCTIVPSNRNGKDTYLIAESDLLAWVEDRKTVKTSVPPVLKAAGELTIEDISETLLKMVQKAYSDGYTTGQREAKRELRDQMKEVFR